jgi:argininosuccinate lyase
MLSKIGILNSKELQAVEKCLSEIDENKFQIKPEDEDVHTAVENYLTEKLGDVGRKIHTARSRNDLVLADLKLFAKDNLAQIEKALNELCTVLGNLSSKYKGVPMPGYTHMQKAMPSSVSLWLDAFLLALKDDLALLKSTYDYIDQCPLGSAAGYGVPLDIDKEMLAKELGFAKTQENPLHAQNTRGKMESVVLSAFCNIMLDLNKLATDLLLFSTKEFGFFSLPEEFCTGSSIMPQKKNPDVLELLRAKYGIMLGYQTQVNSIIKNLPSGYNRDLQLAKEPFIKGIELTLSCIKIAILLLNNLKVNKENLEKACTPEMYAAEKAYELVKKGIPFREAYKQVSKNLKKQP